VPVIGIIPHADVVLPSEDSEALRGVRTRGEGKSLIGVIKFPRMANFTDLDPLFLEDVSTVFVEKASDLDGVDAIVMPGTKNTVSDYLWMEHNGIADVIRKLWKKIPLVGICGGYQMMGKVLDDSSGIENGESAVYEGLGFFDNTTKFGEYTKQIIQNEGRLAVGDRGEITGYELHMGISEVHEKQPLVMLDRFHADPVPEGSVREEDLTFGTYQHGIFDKPAFRKYFLSFVKHDGKPVENVETKDYDSILEENLDKLAQVFEDNMDVDRLLEIAGVRE
jgi:adenosylcobyric acid synthase